MLFNLIIPLLARTSVAQAVYSIIESKEADAFSLSSHVFIEFKASSHSEIPYSFIESFFALPSSDKPDE